MPRAVLDANVYVSAIIQPAGTPGRLIERFLREASFEVVLSPAIVDEVLRALGYPKVRKLLRGADAQLWFEDIVVLADVVADTQLHGVCQDPDDDKYVAAALEGREISAAGFTRMAFATRTCMSSRFRAFRAVG